MNEKSDSHNEELSKVLEKICEIAEKSADGDYIFRGETELHEQKPYYGKVSSNLCREYLDDIEEESFEIEFVQKEILDEAKKYSNKEDFEILTELQHYGSKTNLIDFTTDYLIALFFACDGSHSKDGRVILQKRSSVESILEQPHEPRNRVMAQKSLFIRPPKGYIDPDVVITIESYLKQLILDYLRNSHNICTETIYNDLHGFITNRSIHESAYTQFHKGMTCQNRGNSEVEPIMKMKWYDRAVGHYTEALKLKPDLDICYNNRGVAFQNKGEIDQAIADYNKAIEIDSNDTNAYNNRANVYRDMGNFQLAFKDYNTAIRLDPECASTYNNRGLAYKSRSEFDLSIQDYDIALKLDPQFAEAYTNRGGAYSGKGDFDKGIKEHSKALVLFQL